MAGGRARAAGPQAALAVLTLAANLLGYGFTLVMSRALPVARFGELSALVGILVVSCVAGTALQAQVARRIAAGDRPEPARVLGDSVLVALGVAVVVLALSPVLVWALDIGSWWSVGWLAAATVPTTVAFGVQGLLQGRHQLVRLGAVLALVQLAKFGGGLAAAVIGGGTASVPLAFALVAAATAVVSVGVVPLAGPARVGRPGWTRPLAAALLRDVGAVLGVLVLTSLDLLVARAVLTPQQSGLYAAGNVVTRAAFWGPMFVALAAYPRLSDPATRAVALRRAATVLAVIGAVGVVAGVFARGLLPLLLGPDYAPVAGLAWLFALQGAALAAVQLGIYAGLAVHDRRGAVALWAVAVLEVVVLAAVTRIDGAGVTTVIAVSTGCSLLLVAVLAATVGRARPAGPAGTLTPRAEEVAQRRIDTVAGRE